MDFHSGHIYHVYNQGNNTERIFFEKDNYLYFLRKMKKMNPYAHLLAWCLMPNHFHWLIKVKDEYKKRENGINPLNRRIGTMQSSYTQAMNKRFNRSGSLFRTRTKAKILSKHSKTRDYYGIICFLYIHQNPVKAGLVTKMEDWPFSSFRDYAGMRDGKLCNKQLAIELFDLPDAPKEFYKFSMETIDNHTIKGIF